MLLNNIWASGRPGAAYCGAVMASNPAVCLAICAQDGTPFFIFFLKKGERVRLLGLVKVLFPISVCPTVVEAAMTSSG